MKYAFASALAALVVVGAAVAQTTPTTPAVPTVVAAPPAAAPVASACPAYPAPPAVPTAESIRNERDLNAGTVLVNAYLSAYQTVHNCRVNEIQVLKAQSDARVGEAKAAQEGALAFRANWQSIGEAVIARGGKQKEKDNRSGRQ